MAKKVKEFQAKGWKSNPALKDLDGREAAEYIKSPAFTEKDYIDIHAGLYPNIDPDSGYYRESAAKALLQSSFNNQKTNAKAVDFLYDVVNLKKDWNEKNPKNVVSLSDQDGGLKVLLKQRDLPSKKLHEIISEPKYMTNDRYSDQMKPPSDVLDNPKIKPEHLYKYLTSHPSHIDDLIGHKKSDDRLEDMIFDKPENLKNMSSSSLANHLSSKLKSPGEGQPASLQISPKRAKQIAEAGHDKLYNDALFKVMDKMEPADKKDFVDRKLGITGGKPGGLGAWRTEDDATNQEVAGKWGDWENGPEYDEKFAKRIASSPHLTDDQADHIKRQGSFDAQYELYHNKNVDPKHGAEMFKLWHDDDTAKGYVAEQLQDRYKKDKDDIYSIDDLDPSLINEDDLYETADQDAEERYPYSEYIDDNSDELSKEIDLDEDDEEKIREKLHEDYDWNSDNPDHDKNLQKLHQSIVDADGAHKHIDQIPEITGGKTAKDLGIDHLADADGEISDGDLIDHMNENNPEEINYQDNSDRLIDEHPDYDDRYEETASDYRKSKLRDNPHDYYDNFYEGHRESQGYQDAYSEAMKDAKEQAAKEHYGELYASSHQDDRFIPEHLKAHIPDIEEVKRKRKRAIGEPTDFLDHAIPNRESEHSYGEDQHLHELLKDYSDANGGTVDIGRMHRLMPGQGDTWKKIFGQKGKLTSNEIQQKIDAIPKTKYGISYGKWEKGKMQNINNRDQLIVRLDHSDDSIKPLQEDENVYNTFKRVQEVSKKSGHPTKDQTIAWARVDTTDPKHWMIDEVQSDFGKTVREYLKKEGDDEKADHIQKIDDYHKNWRENLINHVINTAKKNGVDKISTHSPESKAAHTGAGRAHTVYKDSYQKIPRRMGFKPAKAIDLPITDDTKESVFNKNPASGKSTAVYEHHDAWKDHTGWADIYNQMAGMYQQTRNNDLATKAIQNRRFHEGMANKHKERAMTYLPEGGKSFEMSTELPPHLQSAMVGEANTHMENNTNFEHPADKAVGLPAKDFSKPDYHEGHTLNLKPNLIKAMFDIAEDLVKFELIVKHTTDLDIKKRASISINLIKSILGYEIDTSKWQSRRRIFANDIQKAVQSPSKHIGLNRLKQIKTDNGMGAGGQEYDEGELHNAINERANAGAERMVRDAGRQEKEMAQRAQDEASGVGGASPADFPMFNKPKIGLQANPKIRQIADQYAQSKGLSLNHNIGPVKVDPANSKKIAEAYHNAKHEPNDPHVKSAYDALIGETNDQFKHMLSTGLKISKIQPGQENPYKTSKDLFDDIKNNNHISYFPTDQGFGSGGEASDHPMLQPTEHIHEGKPMLANDVFRIVHDYFGHAKEGNGFGANGEEAAWKHHMQMFSPMAQKALTSETRGQNSWVNFGPHGEKNRKDPANTTYADQKATILPDWASKHGPQSVYSKLGKSELSGRHLQKLEILMKGKPKVIELETGANKGRVVHAARGNTDSSAIHIKPKAGSDPLLGANTNKTGHRPIVDTQGQPKQAGWDKNRKHKVISQFTTTPPTPTTPSPGTWSSSGEGSGPQASYSGKITHKHSHPAIPHSVKQKSLLHGIDLSKVKQQDQGWTSSMTLSGMGKNSKGKGVVVKGHLDADEAEIGNAYNHQSGGLSSSQREALYHNLAHGAFGLGKFVPTTAVASLGGTHYSVMEKVPKASHFERHNRGHQKILQNANKKGDLQKLAIMNVILGNSDRHGGNYMISPKGIHLIDHGLTFNYNNNNRDIYDSPSYIDHAYPDHSTSEISLHPDTVKWLKGLDMKQIKAHLKAHKIPDSFKRSILGSLQAAKKGLKYNHLGGVLKAAKQFHLHNEEHHE